MVLWLTNRGPFVSPLPTDLKLPVQVREATTRTKKKKKLVREKITRGDGVGGGRGLGLLYFSSAPKTPTKKPR